MKKVAIIGRPNVGKSTLFNKMCRRRRAIVADIPGITRDRLYGSVEWQGNHFEVIDTGGIIPDDTDQIRSMILDQASVALKEADLILLLVNGRDGLLPLDEAVAVLLRPVATRTAIVVNKLDTPSMFTEMGAFYKLGMDEVFPLSAEHNIGLSDLLDYIVAKLGLIGEVGENEVSEDVEEIRVAIVGRPNVGKSTLLNHLVGEERSIVSPTPGTTRDSVVSLVRHHDQSYRFVDTAGIRRKGKTSRQIESLGVIMAQKSLNKAQVALLMIDAQEGVTKQDADIAGLAAESGCSVLLILNKWDLLKREKRVFQSKIEDLRRRMKFLDFAPVLTVSALTGFRVEGIYPHILRASEGRCFRVSTGALNNQFLPRVRQHLMNSGRISGLGVHFLTQVGTAPPTFVIFLSSRVKLHFSLERYLENRLRENYGFYATPIRILQRRRKRLQKP